VEPERIRSCSAPNSNMSTTTNFPAPSVPASDIETGNGADSLKDPEKQEVEEKRKLVFMDEKMVKHANCSTVIIILVFLLPV
jgi:hypothetical protein